MLSYYKSLLHAKLMGIDSPLYGSDAELTFLNKSSETEKLVVSLQSEDYRWLYRNFKIGELLDLASHGVDVIKNWLDKNFGLSLMTANNFMNCAERFANVKSSLHLSQSQMIEMLVCIDTGDEKNECTFGRAYINMRKIAR